MPYPSYAQVSLLDAIARAAALRIAAELLSGVEIGPHDLIVALTTSDSDPLLIVRRRNNLLEPVDELLENREQSGVDRWDYPLSVYCWRDRLILRLSRGSVTCDVPVIQSAQAILYTHGWCDDPTLVAPTSVFEEEFRAALELFGRDVPPGSSE